MTTERFSDRVGVVTGAASGLGLAVAERLSTDGATVVCVDRDESVVTVAERIGGLAIVGDVSEEEDVAAYAKAALDAYGRIDLFFNNAGIEPSRMPITDLPIAEFDRVLAVNVRGVFLGLQQVMRVMKTNGGGAIVNTASVAAFGGAQNVSPYVTSKHAVLGLTRCAALEGAPHHIRCNAVCPGSTDTPMARRLAQDSSGDPAENMKLRAARIPLGRFGKAEEIANCVTWLLSDEASYATGAAFAIDGGRLSILPG